MELPAIANAHGHANAHGKCSRLSWTYFIASRKMSRNTVRYKNNTVLPHISEQKYNLKTRWKHVRSYTVYSAAAWFVWTTASRLTRTSKITGDVLPEWVQFSVPSWQLHVLRACFSSRIVQHRYYSLHAWRFLELLLRTFETARWVGNGRWRRFWNSLRLLVLCRLTNFEDKPSFCLLTFLRTIINKEWTTPADRCAKRLSFHWLRCEENSEKKCVMWKMPNRKYITKRC